MQKQVSLLKVKSPIHLILCCALSGAAFSADPPGIPEPSMVIYGTVTDGVSVPGKTYQVEQAVTLDETAWKPIGERLRATSTTTSASLTDPPALSRIFYRVSIFTRP